MTKYKISLINEWTNQSSEQINKWRLYQYIIGQLENKSNELV